MRRNVLILLAVLGLVGAACGSQAGGTDEAQPGDTTQAPATTAAPSGEGGDGSTGELSGQIVVSGSSTVEPVTARVAEDFAGMHPGVAISVDGPGTSDGFVLFCNGETDISDASRPIKQSEIDTCLENGVEPIEIRVAIDGLSVLTSVENDLVDCLDFGDLYALLGAESTGFQQWSDANDLAAELQAAGLGGNHAPYPDEPLVVTAPGEESGTFDSFVEIVLEGIAEERGQEPEPRPDYVASPNDNVIIEGISGSRTSLGWVGYAFFLANQDVVKALAVDGGEGCVAPTPDTIASGEYPIARPLFIYVNRQRAEEKPELTAFVDYYLTDQGLQEVNEAGYVPLTDEEYEASRSNWNDRVVITQAAG